MRIGCFRKPDGCNPITSCQSFVSYTFNATTQTIEFHLIGTRNWVAFGQKLEGDGGTLMVRNFFVTLRAWAHLAVNFPTKFKGLLYHTHIEDTLIDKAKFCEVVRGISEPNDLFLNKNYQKWFEKYSGKQYL